MKDRLIYTLFLIPIIFIAGCIQQTITEYNDNALALEIKSPSQVIPNQIIELTFYLTNQVENDINNVEIRLSDPYGLRIVGIDCDIGGESRGDTCYFNKIQSLDEKVVVFRLKVPSEQEIANIEQELLPEITVKYDYFGQTVMTVPIIKKGEIVNIETKPPEQSTGPIKVNIEKAVGVGVEEGELVREGGIFSIIVRIEDVINPESEITIDNFEISLSHLSVYTETTGGKCDFDVRDNKLIPKEKIVLPQEFPLVCTLKTEGNIPFVWVPGTITVNFSYRYKIVESVSIQIITKLI